MWSWDGVWQEDGEHRVLLLKDTVSTTAQKLGLWVPGVKFFGILKAFRSLCYKGYSRLETLLPSNFKMTPVFFSYFCDICNRICNFSLRIKYHLFHHDNNFLIFAVIQPQNSCLQFYFFTLIVLHSKSTSSHCIILWNLDIWWMNMHSLYCGFCLHSQPLHLPPPFGTHLHIYTYTRSFHSRFIFLICVCCLPVLFHVVSLATLRSSNETLLTHLSFPKTLRGLFQCSQHSSTWSCHGIFCWGWDYIILTFVAWSPRQSVQATISNQHMFAQ